MYIFGANFLTTVSNESIDIVALVRAIGQGSSFTVRGNSNGGGGLCPVGIAYIDGPVTGIEFIAQTSQAVTTSNTSKMWYVKLSD